MKIVLFFIGSIFLICSYLYADTVDSDHYIGFEDTFTIRIGYAFAEADFCIYSPDNSFFQGFYGTESSEEKSLYYVPNTGWFLNIGIAYKDFGFLVL